MKEYFSHDYNARNDLRLVRLQMKHGLAGLGAYWCIVEMLYEEGGYLFINEYERITFELRTSYEIITSVIQDFELFQNDGEKFWSKSALIRLNERANKSEKARQSISKRWEKYERNTNVLQTNNDGNTIKVKESIEKEINIPFDVFWNLYDKKRGDKVKIQKKWEALTDNERQKIIDYIPKYIQSQPDKQFRKDPETFLNNKSWNDEIIPKSFTVISGHKPRLMMP